MGPVAFFGVILCLMIQSSTQHSIAGKLNEDSMVSDDGSGDIASDDWNRVPRGCGGKPAEIYFVLDTASGAGPAALSQQKNFLQELSALFPLDSSSSYPSHIRVGVVTFGFTPITSTPLGQAPTLRLLRQAVGDAPRVGGSRRTAQALKYLRKTAFSPAVARPDAAHVVILLTNGYSSDAKQTAMEAALLRQQGAIVYTVSTSPSGSGHVDKGELLEVASGPREEFVFSADGWGIVDSVMEVLRINECSYQVLPPVVEKEPVCVSRRPTELAFAVEHLGLGSPRTQKIIAFIQDLLAEVDPDSPMKAAILTSKDPVARYAFSRHVNAIPLLEKKLGGLVFPDLAQLLRRAGKVLTRDSPAKDDMQKDDNESIPKKNSRSRRSLMKNPSKFFSPNQDVQKVLVVFVDDSVHISKKALAIARKNRQHKVDIYVVYVGQEAGERKGRKAKEEEEEEEGLDITEVKRLASGSDHVIPIPGYSQLSHRGTVVDTLRTVCRGL